MSLRKYSVDQLKEAVSKSFTLSCVLKQLGLSPSGGNYECLKKAINEFSLDSSHFTGQGHLKGKTHQYKTRPLEIILVEGKLENTVRLKIRLLKAGLKNAECEMCKNIKWQNKPIPLELHHEDGDRKNNVLSNLSLLCPNCHALTDNYRGKNKKV